MARLIGETPFNHSEMIMYDFVMRELPDYICASFSPNISLREGEVKECDMLLFVPHMGVYILEICGASAFEYSEGEYYYIYKNGRRVNMRERRGGLRLRGVRYQVKEYLKRKFNITPLVYEFACFPDIMINNIDSNILPPDFDPAHIITADDLKSGLRFLYKLMSCSIYTQEMTASHKNAQEREELFTDLTDKKVNTLFRFWNTGCMLTERPENPPLIFLSYNQLNSERAEEIKELLEAQDVFVWRAPEDVPAGTYYMDYEMQAIEACDLFLILLSYSSQESKEVRIEFEKAVELNKKIFPLWIDDCVPNEYYSKHLEKYQWRKMPVNDINVIEEILKTVKMHP